ncbi:hypothetical protein LTR95_002820 [Oleoguttula sp. CCFEE 5521]
MPSLDDFLAIAKQMRPMIPMYIHLLASALFPIVTGAYASLSRPSTAAKPAKDHIDDKDDDEDDTPTQMEGLSPRDAIVFPVTAGLVLAGLYWAIKRYGAKVINLVFGYYFAGVGLFSVGKIINDGLGLGLGMVFPGHYAWRGRVWKAEASQRKAVALHDGKEMQDGMRESRESPLPGWLGNLRLSNTMTERLWNLRALSRQKYSVKLYAKNVVDSRTLLTALNVISAIAGTGIIAYNHFIDKPWWLTNLQGFAVSYSAMQLMSPTTFATGSLILGGLFFYDIWAVFFTPLMVTVAKNLDQPIKLLFPRPDEPGKDGADPVKSYSMLGLGDIVLPGLVIGLALRFDLHMYYLRKQKSVSRTSDTDGTTTEVVKAEYTTATGLFGSRLWTIGVPANLKPATLTAAAFPKPYFVASLVGYVIGMLTTLGVMTVFQHAQPALLYLVPGVLISTWSTAIVRGELTEFWNYTEAVNGEPEDPAADESKSTDETEKARPATDIQPLTWWNWTREQVLGSPKSSETKTSDVSPKDAEKSVSTLERLAIEAPDRLFSLEVTRHVPSARGKKSEGDAGSSDEKETSSEVASSSDPTPVTTSASESGSEDAVLVGEEGDDQEDAERYPTRRVNLRSVRRAG